MLAVTLILLILALVCFVCAALRVATKFELAALGLAFAILVPLIETVNALGGT